MIVISGVFFNLFLLVVTVEERTKLKKTPNVFKTNPTPRGPITKRVKRE